MISTIDPALLLMFVTIIGTWIRYETGVDIKRAMGASCLIAFPLGLAFAMVLR